MSGGQLAHLTRYLTEHTITSATASTISQQR